MKYTIKIPSLIKLISFITSIYLIIHPSSTNIIYDWINLSFDSGLVMPITILVKIGILISFLIFSMVLIKIMIKIVNLIFQLIFGILHFFGNSKSDLRGTIFNLGKEILKDIDFKEILLVGISIWSLSQFFTEKQTVLLFGVFYATFSYIKYLHKTKITKDEIEELIDRKVRKS